MVLRGQPVGEQGAADRWTALDPHPAGSGAGGGGGGGGRPPPPPPRARREQETFFKERVDKSGRVSYNIHVAPLVHEVNMR